MKTKKLLSVILSFVITVLSLSFGAVSASAAVITPTTPKTDSNGVYQISNAQELYGFAELVNNGNTDENTKAVLTADIEVNTGVLKADGTLNSGTFTDWTPIGNYSNQYTGKFDGQNHTISGLYFNNTSTSYIGLFSYLGSGGKIKNVGVIDSYFSGYVSVGGVCGANFGIITASYNTGTVSGKGEVGGVCGANFGIITASYNTGTVKGGGYVGGVCGTNNGGTITDCYNTGKVDTGIAFDVGGVCGYNSGGTITGCYNTGTVSGLEYVGGVCGENNSTSTSTGTITGCYNTGTVSGINVGGVCGYNNGGTITGSYNTGTVSGNNGVGGVCGYNYLGTITGCYTNSGGVYGENDNGTVIDCEEYTGDEFKDGTVCVLLNKAISSSYDVTFYQGEEIPLFFSKTENRYCTVNYTVAPSYTVTIPQTVTLGETVTIKAENVVLEEDKQLEVSITGTSGDNNAFAIKSADGEVLEYTVTKADSTTLSLNDKILTVNPDNTDTDSTTLKFNTPGKAKFSGEYKGTVTFTVSIN